VTPSSSKTPYEEYYAQLKANGLLPDDEKSAQSTGYVGAAVAFLGSLTAGFVGYKIYKRKQTVRQWKKNQKHYQKDGSEKPNDNEPQSPKEAKVSVQQNSFRQVFQNQPQDIQRTMHGPMHIQKHVRSTSVENPLSKMNTYSVYNSKQPLKKTIRPKSFLVEKSTEYMEQ
jgi:uncharacterized protein HemX